MRRFKTGDGKGRLLWITEVHRVRYSGARPARKQQRRTENRKLRCLPEIGLIAEILAQSWPYIWSLNTESVVAPQHHWVEPHTLKERKERKKRTKETQQQIY